HDNRPYAQWGTACARLAAGFSRHGVAPGDRVVMFIDNRTEFVFTHRALGDALSGLHEAGTAGPLGPGGVRNSRHRPDSDRRQHAARGVLRINPYGDNPLGVAWACLHAVNGGTTFTEECFRIDHAGTVLESIRCATISVAEPCYGSRSSRSGNKCGGGAAPIIREDRSAGSGYVICSKKW